MDERPTEALWIADAAWRVGVSVGTLRLWESQGLVQPARDARGRRYYLPADVHRLRQIRLLRVRDGLNAAAIRAGIGAPGEGDAARAEADEAARINRKERGVALHARRRRAGLTIAAASMQAGIATSFLSSIERGVAGISPSTEARLLAAYDPGGNTHIGAADDAAVGGQHTDGALSLAGGASLKYLTSLTGLLEAQLLELPPGAESPGTYDHFGEEFAYVLNGSLSIWLDGAPQILTVGQSLHFASRIPHRWANQSDAVVRALWITTEAGLWNLRDRSTALRLEALTNEMPSENSPSS